MSRYISRHTGQEIDNGIDAIKQFTNPNLLDNWYFGNPVNQRGQATYTSSENQYTIDRWIKETGTLTVADGCISTDMTGWSGVLQRIEPDLFKALAGKTLTVSILYKNGQLQKVTFTPDSNYTNTNLWMGLDSGFGTVIYRWSDGLPNLTYSNSQNGELVAIKLELGYQQTLAHQDENGNWVLNEIPDYGEQLRRCQRYQAAFPAATHWRSTLTTSDFIDFAIPLPANLRATPVVPSSALMVCTTTGAGGFTDFSFAVAQYGSQLRVRATKASHGLTDAVLECVSLAVFDANL